MRIGKLFLRIAGFVGLIVGCGAGDKVSTPPPPPPPPGPVVATVEVTPPTRSLIVDDTVRFRAVARTAAGTEVTGRAVGWASSNPTAASVSNEGLVTGLATGQSTITASVDGKSGSAQITVADIRVTLDSDASKTLTLGPTGGTIAATATGGLAYELAIPRGALDSSVTMTMTPVTRFRRLPFSGGVVGAVELKPSGLRFNLPAELTIKVAPTVPANMKLVGFSWTGDGDSLRLEPAPVRNGAVTLLVSHFSGAGAVLGTTADFSQIPLPPAGSAEITATNALATLAMPADQAQIVAVLRTWAQAIKVAAQQANTDLTARAVLLEYNSWVFKLEQLDPPPATLLLQALAADNSSLKAVVGGAILRGIESANLACNAARSLVPARNVLRFLTIIENMAAVNPFGDLRQEPGLDETSVLTGLCVFVVATGQTLPDPLTPGASATLQLRFGFAFTDTPTQVENSVFQVGIAAVGTTADGVREITTDNLGQGNTQVTASGSTQMRLSVAGCFHPSTLSIPARPPKPTPAARPGDICREVVIVRNFGRTVNGDVIVNSDLGLAQIADVSVITGTLLISGAQVTATDLRLLGQLAEVRGTLGLFNLPNLTSLVGLERVTVLGGLSLINLPNITRPVLPLGVSALPLGLSLGNMPVADLGGLRGLSDIGHLSIGQIPATGLGQLGNVKVASLALTDLPNLQSLGTIVVGPVAGSITLGNLPQLGSAGPLALVTTLTGELTYLSELPIQALPNLTTARGVQVYGGARSGGIGFPTLISLTNLSLVSGNSCVSVGEIYGVSIPLLTSVEHFSHGGVTGCLMTLTAPNLTVTRSVLLQGRISSVALKAVITTDVPGVSTNLVVRGTELVSFAAPVNVLDLIIENNAKLASVTVSGTVRRDLIVRSNPLLSSQAIAGWPLSVGRNRNVSGNGSP